MRKFSPLAPFGATPQLGIFEPQATRCRKLLRSPQKPKRAPTKERKPVLLFPSMKAGLIGARRYWYIDLFYLLDADPVVVSYTTETTQMVFECDGAARTHRPDIVVEERSGRLALSLLLEAEATNPDNVHGIAVLKELYAERGMRFQVITDADLKGSSRLNNAKTLFRHRDIPLPSTMSFALAAAVAHGPLPTLGAVHQALGGTNEAWIAVLGLVARGFIEADLGIPLGSSTRIIRIVGDGVRS